MSAPLSSAGAHLNRSQTAVTGILIAIAACACFAALDTTTKYVSTSVPILMALWMRYMVQAVATSIAILPTRGLAILRTRHPRFQVLRGMLLLTTSLFGFASLKYMPVGEFTAIVMIAPLVITLLAATVLKETVSALRWALVAGGFIGTLIIIRPNGDNFQWASLFPLGLVVSNAWFQVLTSKLARTEDPITMHLYTGWVGTLVITLALPFAWVALPDWRLWALMCFIGAMATIGHFLLILAYQRAPAASLTPFLYSQIAFAMLGGFIVFRHVPDGLSMLGMTLIAACGLGGAWLTVRERRVAVEPVKA